MLHQQKDVEEVKKSSAEKWQIKSMKVKLNSAAHEKLPLNETLTDIFLTLNKCSVLRRQSRDTNRNINGLVYCQYG